MSAPSAALLALLPVLFLADPASGSTTPAPRALAEVGEDVVLDDEYGVTRVEPGDDTRAAVNAAQGFRTCFSTSGLEVSGKGEAGAPWKLGLRTVSWGRGASLETVAEGTVTSAGRRVEIERGSFTEWYVNDARGIEQGFTIREVPVGEHVARDEPLKILLRVEGGFELAILPGERSARFTGPARLAYSGLRAWDAEGVELEARFARDGADLAILVDDAEAVYPLTIDPWIWTEEVQLFSGIPEDNALFGRSVSIWRNTAVVGADMEDETGLNDTGAAFVFERTGTAWSAPTRLIRGDAQLGDRFGFAVSVSDDTAVVGAHRDDDAGADTGSAYVFVLGGTSWSLQSKLLPIGAQPGDQFGGSVSISGDTALIGAHVSDEGPLGDAGAAYVFERSGTTWSQQARIIAGDAEADDQFGCSVAYEDDTAVIGSAQDDDDGVDSGSAYVFVRDGTAWSQQAKLTALDAFTGDMFGSSVAICGEMAVVGAPHDDVGGLNAGSAYVFVRSGTTWSQQAKLTAGATNAHASFGVSVSVSGDLAVVGADGRVGSTGSAYVFERTGTSWSRIVEHTASDGTSTHEFGHSVSISGNSVLVGAWRWEIVPFADRGSAYVFVTTPVPPGPNLIPWHPNGWDDTIVVSAVPGTHVDTLVSSGRTVYIDFAEKNHGSHAGAHTTRLTVDGAIALDAPVPPLPALATREWDDQEYIFPTAGTYRIQIEVDVLDDVATETNETDNIYWRDYEVREGASATFHNPDVGGHVNPAVYTALTLPIHGEVYQVQVDTAPFYGALLVAYSTPLTLPSPIGNVLTNYMDPYGELFGGPIAFGDPAYFA